MERKYAYCVGDVVVYDSLTYDVIKATYGYIVIKNELREIKIKNKGDFYCPECAGKLISAEACNRCGCNPCECEE